MIHPQARALLDLIEANGVPPTHTLTPVEARRFYRERRRVTLGDVPAADWDAVREAGFDHVFMMGVWRRSAVGRGQPEKALDQLGTTIRQR